MRAQSTCKPFTVFIAKDYETTGIIKDEVVAIGDHKYKSIKFRHTYYDETDFNYSMEEAEAIISKKLDKYVPAISISLAKNISLLAI